MANLAIKGHATRGKEVIELLEMLGGINYYNATASDKDAIYLLREADNYIIATYNTNQVIFTLEEFLEKYPYKVGDKVRIYGYESEVRIDDMKWDGYKIKYRVFTDEPEWYSTDELNETNQPYKEETMETITIDDFKANTKEWLIDKLHGMIISDAIKTIGNIHGELHKPKYQKTYVECCETLNVINTEIPYIILSQLGKPITSLGKLIVCRDAYWKIAGEQMGLGKPWEPDWKNDEQFKYVIICRRNCVVKDTFVAKDVILAFPTEEMQDAFHENFKDLIEECKQFL